MGRHNIHVYMLYLLDFEDGRVVFTNDQSLEIKKSVQKIIKEYGHRLDSCDAEFDTHTLNIEGLNQSLASRNTQLMELVEAKIGYYHHRFISHFKLKNSHNDINVQIRKIRDILRQYSNTIVEKCKEEINNIRNLQADGKIKGFFEYQLIVAEKSTDILDSFQIPFSFQTTSLCFDIIKPTYFFPERMLVRISIPCAVIYGHIQVDKDKTLVRDFINAIYQHALYGRKKRLVEMGASVVKSIKDPYKIDEQDLQDLWAYMIDTMGGKTSNVYSFKVIRVTLFITIIVCILTIALVGKEIKEMIFKESPAKETIETTGNSVDTGRDKLVEPVCGKDRKALLEDNRMGSSEHDRPIVYEKRGRSERGY
ncbi:MAG: hypothetical protein HZB31_04320 [Nitrospirae bacterium]|nr:hypothetical protein [Nitrospirota bacterium]